jgi:hypothetical protein
MRHPFEKESILSRASEDVVLAVGRLMLVFANIDGWLDFAIRGLSTFSQSDVMPNWKKIERLRTSEKLDRFGELVKDSIPPEHAFMLESIEKIKELIKYRNIAAHYPLVESGRQPERYICKMDVNGDHKVLFSADINILAEEADEAYNDLFQLFFIARLIESD